MATLLRRTLNNNKNSSKGTNKNWIHPPDALQGAHVAYLVKFLGQTEAEQPKGIEVVKEGIRKLKFSQQLKRSEGTKIPKVELTISIDGVAIQDPKTKRISYQYPLHRISYCADDKSDKKFFSFIAKEADSDIHSCFVFVSDKLAEEITLTIGQAFDLAYRRFLESSGRDLEMKKRIMILQKKVQDLEMENIELRKRLLDLEPQKNNLNTKNNNRQNGPPLINGNLGISHTKAVVSAPALQPPPPIPPRHSDNRSPNSPLTPPSQDLLVGFSPVPAVGRKLENLILDDMEDFNPRSTNGTVVNGVNGNHHAETNGKPKDLFGSEPFNPVNDNTVNEDPFGMGDFNSQNLEGVDLENAIGAIDKRIVEMRDGFSRGLSFGNEDFSLESLDPLNKTNC